MNALNPSQLGLKRTIRQLMLHDNAEITLETLESKARELAGILFSSLTSEEISEVIADLTTEHTVTLRPGGSIVDSSTFEAWLQERKKSASTPRWNAYEELLVSRDWDAPVIRDLGVQTDDIVELLGDPEKPGPWSRKGLLMGEVQSGKTATYLGVVNKAMDYGYRLVIVIGGHTNELRRQTQQRFDSDLFGVDTEYLGDGINNVQLPVIGIGSIDSSLKSNILTTVRGDFNVGAQRSGIAWVNSQIPTVFVIKKNASVIKNVTRYIRQQAVDGVLDMPLLVIDDEADWGSPNVSDDTDPAAVNRAIRDLLARSTRNSYIGITATPFANVFINHETTHDELGEDIFPSDFIRVMSSNSQYAGIDHYFRPRSQAVKTNVDDCIALIPINHKSSHIVSTIPNSLDNSLATFLVGTAVRRLRENEGRPASMLVNVSRFNDVQKQVSDLLVALLERYVRAIMTEFALENTALSEHGSKLKDAWTDLGGLDLGVTWGEVKSALLELMDSFTVELVNSKTAVARRRRRKLLSAEQRNAEDRRPTIFVGGDVLSRGLTLEGLQVSYFVREPRTMDTLMQMGRWFGYRPGYNDLVKIWLPEDTAEDFEWSAEATDELRQMLFEMKARELTPKQFGLRMQTHPDGFMIVAANKRRAASQVSVHSGPVLIENKLVESHALSSNPTIQAQNRAVLENFVDTLDDITATWKMPSPDDLTGYAAWRNVPLKQIQTFLASFRGATNDIWFGASSLERPTQITDAIVDAKGSETWDVVLVPGSGPEYGIGSTRSVKTSIRNRMRVDGPAILLQGRRVASANNLYQSLSAEDQFKVKDILNQTEPDKEADQRFVLGYLEHPTLLIYALAVDNHENPAIATADSPLIAVGIAFPKLDPAEAVRRASNARRYLVNTVYLAAMMNLQSDGDDYLDLEDE